MGSRTTLKGDRVGIFTLDPGRTSGVTESTPVLGGTIRETFNDHPLKVYEIDCEDHSVDTHLAEISGARDIYILWTEFEYHCLVELGIPKGNIFFVIEDFVLRSGRDHNSDRSGLSPVRVTNAILGMLANDNTNYVWQSPSDAMSSFPNKRLKSMSLWTRGKVHGRDATRHAALFARRASQ